MPSITPGYLYTIVALTAVSGLLIFSFMAYTEALRASSEIRQLKNLLDYVSAKSIELSTLTLTTNTTSETFLPMPTSIGNKQYWLRLRSNSEKTWLEGGLGNIPIEGTELRVYLPKQASATGYYIGGNEVAHLRCYLNMSIPHILLKNPDNGD